MKKIVLSVVLFVGVLLLGLNLFQAGSAPPDTTLDTTQAGSWLKWIAIIAVLAVIAILIYRNRATVRVSILTSGSFSAQVLTSFLVFALVLYAMHGVSPDADLFTTAEGWATIVVYCIAMTVAALVAINFKGWARVTPLIGMLIFFTLTGARSWMLLNSDGVFAQRTHFASIGAWWSSPTSNNVVAVSTGDVKCPGIAPTAPKTLGGEWETINPNGCDLTYYVASGSVEFDGPTGKAEVSNVSNVVGRRNYLVLTQARATSGTAQLLYMLCPKGKGPTDGGWSCRS